MSHLILDASAMLAFFKRQERGHDRVVDIIKDPSYIKEAHALNVMELYKRTYSLSASKAEESVCQMRCLGVTIAEDMDDAFWKEMAWLKVTYGNVVSLADCAVIALAKRRNAELLGSDSDAFLGMEKAGIIRLKRFR